MARGGVFRWFTVVASLVSPGGATARDAGRFAYNLFVNAEEEQADPVVWARTTPAFAACQKRAKITSEYDACFAAEFKRQDAALNHVWKATFARIKGPDHAGLLAAQREWLAARDPFCHTDADGFEGGTIMTIVYGSCQVELTIRRTIWLEHLR
ncbi:lysozyme inhibitor LprI family protein [Novosphingobium sp.]|uniref:lysozyme inhibitor LprI family protein n=1 Tax=Novosphingobium sp. TaxID=1874826 RepID=UPI0033427D7F